MTCFPTNNAGTLFSGYVGDDKILANINGQIFYIPHTTSDNYHSDYAFTLADESFDTVAKVIITRANPLEAPNQYNDYYKFTATESLTAGGTYYLMLGDFPLRKLTAVAALGEGASLVGNQIHPTVSNQGGAIAIYSGEKFSFQIGTPGSTITPSEWSVKLTNVLTNAETIYSYGSMLQLKYNLTANYATLETTTAPADGLYMVRYLKNGVEVVANSGADGFTYVEPAMLLISSPKPALYMSVGIGFTRIAEVGSPALIMNGYTAEASSAVPELNADFYPVTPPTISTTPIAVSLPATMSGANAFFNPTMLPAELKSAGITPGSYHVVISTQSGNVLGASSVTLPSAFFFNPNVAIISPSRYTYPAAIYGYTEQTAQEFTITNTSEESITNAAAALGSGTAFEISTSLSSTTIAAGNTATVSVQPKTGLAAGTYTDTLTITGDDDLSISAALSFTVTKKPVAITGVTATNRAYDGTTTVELSGGELQDVLSADKTGDGAVGFALGTGAISNANAENGKPVTTNITLTGAKSANYILTQPDNITVDISKAAVPAAPASVTGSYTGDGTYFTYTIDAIEGAEYSKDNSDWQDSPAFSGFTTSSPATTFYARIKETENYLPGAAGDTGAVTFVPLPGPAVPALGFTVSGDGFPKTVTITRMPGAEYRFNDAGYSEVNTYTSNEAENVTLYIRIAATATHEASEPSTVTINTANQNQDAPEAFELETEVIDDESYAVTIPPTDGAEYSFDGVSWSDAEGANIKTGGLPGETVTGYKRLAAKEGCNVSPSVSASVTLPLFQVKTPAASPDGGTFTDSVSVTLSSATADASIYYTTDGGAPTTASTLYAGAFTLTETTTLKAIAVKAGMRDSEVLTAAFTRQAAPPIIDVPGPSGSSSSSDTTKTAPAADGSVSVSYTQTGGAVTVSLPDGKVTELISKSSGTASIDLSRVSNATSASLPASALEKLAEAKLAVELRLPQGTITLESEAANSVAAQAGGSRVSVGIKSVTVSLLNAATREAVGDLTVYDISILGGNKQITGFGGASATIELPYTLKAGETAPGVSAFYVDGNGNMEKLPTSYDASAKKVKFTTKHLSLYAIGYDETLAAPWTNPFLDIKASDWFYGDVEYVHTNGLMNGTGAAAFSPDVKISRAMIVTILYRCEQASLETAAAGGGVPDAPSPGTAFTDVPANEWYTDAVAWASANGIVNGVGGNSFAPDDFITRQDLAAIIIRYADYAEKRFPVTLQYQSFADEAGIAEYAKSAVQTLYCGGIVNGKPGNLFDPTGTATRAEAAALLRRFIEAGK
jgi:hypothetical protein